MSDNLEKPLLHRLYDSGIGRGLIFGLAGLMAITSACGRSAKQTPKPITAPPPVTTHSPTPTPAVTFTPVITPASTSIPLYTPQLPSPTPRATPREIPTPLSTTRPTPYISLEEERFTLGLERMLIEPTLAFNNLPSLEREYNLLRRDVLNTSLTLTQTPNNITDIKNMLADVPRVLSAIEKLKLYTPKLSIFAPEINFDEIVNSVNSMSPSLMMVEKYNDLNLFDKRQQTSLKEKTDGIPLLDYNPTTKLESIRWVPYIRTGVNFDGFLFEVRNEWDGSLVFSGKSSVNEKLFEYLGKKFRPLWESSMMICLTDLSKVKTELKYGGVFAEEKLLGTSSRSHGSLAEEKEILNVSGRSDTDWWKKYQSVLNRGWWDGYKVELLQEYINGKFSPPIKYGIVIDQLRSLLEREETSFVWDYMWGDFSWTIIGTKDTDANNRIWNEMIKKFKIDSTEKIGEFNLKRIYWEIGEGKNYYAYAERGTKYIMIIDPRESFWDRRSKKERDLLGLFIGSINLSSK